LAVLAAVNRRTPDHNGPAQAREFSQPVGNNSRVTRSSPREPFVDQEPLPRSVHAARLAV
jgi:hypothetical protein